MAKSCEIKQKPKTVKEFLGSKQFLKTVLWVIIGAASGFALYHIDWCISSTCSVYSNIIAGAFLGFFITNRPCGC